MLPEMLVLKFYRSSEIHMEFLQPISSAHCIKEAMKDCSVQPAYLTAENTTNRKARIQQHSNRCMHRHF